MSKGLIKRLTEDLTYYHQYYDAKRVHEYIASLYAESFYSPCFDGWGERLARDLNHQYTQGDIRAMAVQIGFDAVFNPSLDHLVRLECELASANSVADRSAFLSHEARAVPGRFLVYQKFLSKLHKERPPQPEKIEKFKNDFLEIYAHPLVACFRAQLRSPLDVEARKEIGKALAWGAFLEDRHDTLAQAPIDAGLEGKVSKKPPRKIERKDDKNPDSPPLYPYQELILDLCSSSFQRDPGTPFHPFNTLGVALACAQELERIRRGKFRETISGLFAQSLENGSYNRMFFRRPDRWGEDAGLLLELNEYDPKTLELISRHMMKGYTETVIIIGGKKEIQVPSFFVTYRKELIQYEIVTMRVKPENIAEFLSNAEFNKKIDARCRNAEILFALHFLRASSDCTKAVDALKKLGISEEILKIALKESEIFK